MNRLNGRRESLFVDLGGGLGEMARILCEICSKFGGAFDSAGCQQIGRRDSHSLFNNHNSLAVVVPSSAVSCSRAARFRAAGRSMRRDGAGCVKFDEPRRCRRNERNRKRIRRRSPHPPASLLFCSRALSPPPANAEGDRRQSRSAPLTQ